MAYQHVHDFSVKALGGRKCSGWKCGAVVMDRPALAQEHSETSKDAAIKSEGVRSRAQALVWNALALYPSGLTTEQVCSITGLSSDSVRPRLVELDEQGRASRLTVNGEPYHPITNKEVVTRANKLGNQMTVWVAAR